MDGDGLIDGVAKYTNWRLGEPNDWPGTGVENNEENHLVIGLGARFIWADMTGNRQGYVVEYEMEAVSEPENGGSGPSGNYYKVVLPGYDMLWEEAARDAWKYDRFLRGKQPHLATIDSAEEGKYIETLRQGTDSGWENGLWLGGYQRPGQESSEHGWRWVHDEGAIGGTVEGVGYSNWNTGEPNDWPTAEENGGEDYLGLRAGSSLWSDISSPQSGYVVEYEPNPASERVHRSTRHSGEGSYWFDHEDEFSRRLEMTVEAWVYREDVSRTESVLSHGSISEGFFFGFAGERIRFGRSGGFAVLSTGFVPSGQWTLRAERRLRGSR